MSHQFQDSFHRNWWHNESKWLMALDDNFIIKQVTRVVEMHGQNQHEHKEIMPIQYYVTLPINFQEENGSNVEEMMFF